MSIKVYYLDDEIDLCENFQDLFAGPDLEIETFQSPGDLIKRCQTAKPDLVLLDYRLPGTTGDEVAKKLDPGIPKILVTGEIHVNTTFPFFKILEKPVKDEAMRDTMLAASRSNA